MAVTKTISIILLVLLVLIQFGLWAGGSSIGSYYELKQAVAEQREENLRNIARNNVLFAEIKDLKTGKEAIEERARNELGMIREGEIFYRVVE